MTHHVFRGRFRDLGPVVTRRNADSMHTVGSDNVKTFLTCDGLYGSAKGDSSDAVAIRGCKARYYSDHDFVSSGLGS